MNCNKYQELANLFIDGELNMQEQMKLFNHLAVCTACGSFVDATVRMKEIRRREQITYPVELDEAILSNLVSGKSIGGIPGHEVRERKHFWERRLTLPVSFVAAAVVTAVIAGLLFGELFLRKKDTQTPNSSMMPTLAQPTTVIMIYGIPPVEIFGKPLVQTKGNYRYQN